jgi:hypothetical protein
LVRDLSTLKAELGLDILDIRVHTEWYKLWNSKYSLAKRKDIMRRLPVVLALIF